MNPNDAEINLSGNASVTGGINRPSQGLPRVSVLYSRFQPSNQVPFIIKAVMKVGIAKNDAQAQRVILVIVILFILAALAMYYFAFKDATVTF